MFVCIEIMTIFDAEKTPWQNARHVLRHIFIQTAIQTTKPDAMRRFLLSIVAFALALTASAQASVQQQQEKYSVVECNPIMVKHSGAVSKAPRKIASNQRWVGYYSSDALADYGMGVPSYPGENKVAIYLTESILKPYIGMKIVGIRFGLCADIGQSSVFLSQIKDGYPDQVLTYTYVQNGVTGWNEETFPKPYTIKAGEELVAGFEYTQYDDDEDHSYPFSAVAEGDGSTPIWFWCSKNGTDYSWLQFTAGGKSMSIQVLVEGDFPDYSVKPYSFKTVRGMVGGTAVANVKVDNYSAYNISKIGYVVTVDGVAGAERTAVVDGGIARGKSGYFMADVPCGTTEGVKDVTVEVTKVDGNNNENTDRVAKGKLNVSSTRFARNLCIEEFTTEKCPNCPRVAGYLHKYLEKADLSRVYVVCHHAAFYTDWLTQPCDEDLTYLFNDAGSTYAPAMMFNREPDFKSAYASGEMDNVTIPSSADDIELLAQYYLNSTDADVKLNMKVAYDEGNNLYKITVSGESNNVFDKESARLTLYMTEDNIAAKSQAGGGSNFVHQHVIRQYNTSWGEPITWNGNSFSQTFEWEVDDTWKKEDIKLVALVNKYNRKDVLDNRIENSIGLSLSEATSIQTLDADENAVEVARYNAAGQRINGKQKGLNIVKLSNGTTLKVVVK